MSDSVERLNSIFGNGSNITMSANKTPYNLQYLTTKKQRDSPTSSILKAPTPIFVTSRRSSVRTKKLTFANGPDITDNEINERREGSHDSASTTSTIELTDSQKLSYDHRSHEGKLIEVALSPVKKMKVSPDSWNAFLEYQKYKDYSSETEKTDYTYSSLSKFRDKEIIPGFRARPNLSRSPIYFNSSYQSFDPRWSSGTSYSIKRTIYENSSSGASRSQLEPDTTIYDGSKMYQNEISEYSKHDGYYSDDTLRADEKYHGYTRFADDGNLFRNRKGFARTSSRLGKQLHLGAGWDVDEADDDFISTTHREDNQSPSSARKAVLFLTAIFTTLFHGITRTSTAFRDLFSRYILRRNTYPYNNYASAAYRPWSQSGTYSYGKYHSYNQGRFSRWWYQSFLYALYSKMTSTISETSYYVRNKYHRSSRRGRLLWFLIPLLLLLALWLSRAEVEDAYVSNQITAFKCRANQYLSPARNQMNSMWRKISGYGEQVFGQSLRPVLSLFRFAGWLVGSCLDWTLTVIGGALRGIFTIFDMITDVLSHFWILFTNVFSDAVEKKDNISNAVYNFFSGIIFTVLSGLTYILGSLGNFIVSAFELFKSMLLTHPFSLSDDMKIETVETEFTRHDTTDQSAYWEGLRKRIEDLEVELEKVKAEEKAGSLAYQKQLENNYKALQRYQAIVNEALRRQSSKQPQLSKSSIQYYVDNMTDELKKWILAHFMLKSESVDMDENKFASLMAKYSNRSGEELKMLQNEFSRFVRQYSAELTSLKTDLNVGHYNEYNGNDLPLSLIKRIVADEIKLHDADKTGKVDFALQSAGGHVLGVKCTKSFNHCFRYNNIFGLHVCSQLRRNAPEEAISPGMAPGQCWAFAGSQGFLILELSHSIIVTGFTMEHISRLVSPNGRIESAPRKFSMWGLKTELDMDPYLFGEYEYKDNNETYQYFPVINYSAHPYKIVELSIASNHGNPNYTCLYRIRVHGDIYPSHL